MLLNLGVAQVTLEQIVVENTCLGLSDSSLMNFELIKLPCFFFFNIYMQALLAHQNELGLFICVILTIASFVSVSVIVGTRDSC